VIDARLLSVGIPVRFETLPLRRLPYAESNAIVWTLAYLGGLGLIS